jgi:DNA-binding transcriptional LysR family regulator
MTGKNDQHRRLKLTLRQVEVFLATAGAGSTRGAAERISRSQSAASGALGELEGALGVKLFDRVGKRLLLNEHGRLLLPQAAALLEQAADLEQQFDATLALPLRIAASLTVGEYVLPSLLAAWKGAHPASKVQVHIANSTAVMEAVSALQADVGFIEGPQTHADLSVHSWLSDEMTIVASPAHPLARRVATNRQLEQAAWALREPGSGTREAAERWLLDSLGSLHVEFEMGSAEALKRLAAEGRVLACLSRRVVQRDIEVGALVEIRTRLPKSRRRLAMVLHRARRPALGAQDFVDLCREFGRSEAQT